MTPTLQDRARLAKQELVQLNGTTMYDKVTANKLYADWALKHHQTLSEALRLAADPDMVYVPRIEMLNRDAWLDMVRLLLPLAKRYVYANAGIRSTECIIEDAEAMIAAAPVATTEKIK